MNNVIISVIMPVYNAEKHISEAIKSVLNQSFVKFELIIIDGGSTDSTLLMVNDFSDDRIVLLIGGHDFVTSSNLGLKNATGKYIACMDANDIMYVDRLKIQCEIMEIEPEITVCGAWVTVFNADVPKLKNTQYAGIGFVENPLVELMKRNILFHSTAMIRKSFLESNHVKYEEYLGAEDYKLWMEIAKHDGVFYIESLPLLYHRSQSDQSPSLKACHAISWKATVEIIEFLLNKWNECAPVKEVYENLILLNKLNIVDNRYIVSILYDIFQTLEMRQR